ncbi:cytochrome b/b6 domain-containing protein [Tropicimonas sp.]|uniref:cytochrome b/b6 domain-containing protein n=1 Tax=Tropicimonas sp. TaxID=2067044 RepID=UPI003A87619A
MALHNSPTRYGLVARSLHWFVALLIAILLPLGFVAENWPYDTGEALRQKMWLFSLHKTFGVTVFFLSLARILWAAVQPHPLPLNGERQIETTLAQTVHWLLYVCLVAVPLTGWIDHAATEGFAPIWWPFGQSLPLVPKSDSVAHIFAALHFAFVILLVIALGLHVAGALKHHLIDRDATLRRMLFGTEAAGPEPARHRRGPAIAAGAILILAMGAGILSGPDTPATPQAADPVQAAASGWQVREGTLAITVRQMGSDVTGSFGDWQAAIAFDEAATGGSLGTAEVTVAIGSLTLGSVTDQALGAEYFDAGQFPAATFRADLLPGEGGDYLAQGSLTLRGVEMPIKFPFTLAIEGDTARMRASTSLDRRDFHIGDTQTSEGTLGFSVGVDIDLTAERSR